MSIRSTAAGNPFGSSIDSSEITDGSIVAADLSTTLTNELVHIAGTETITGAKTFSEIVAGPSGAVGTPAFTFASDLDSGMYRVGANNIALGVNGAKVLDVTTSGLGVTGSVDASTFVRAATLFYLADGSSSTPSLVFNNDTNCGLYRLGADSIGIAINGGEHTYFNSTGTTVVGILTTGGVHRSPDGAVGAPTYSFNNDTDCGLYRIGANNLGIACNGAKKFESSSTWSQVTGPAATADGATGFRITDATTSTYYFAQDTVGSAGSSLQLGGTGQFRVGNKAGDTAAFTDLFTVSMVSNRVVVNDDGGDVDFRVEGDTNANLLFVDASAEMVGFGATFDDGARVHITGDAATADGQAALYVAASDWGAFRVAFDTNGANNRVQLAANSDKRISFGAKDNAQGAFTERMSINNSSREIIVNDEGADADFRIESDANSSVFFVDGGENTVSIGSNAFSNGAVAGGLIVNTNVAAHANGDAIITITDNNSATGRIGIATNTLQIGCNAGQKVAIGAKDSRQGAFTEYFSVDLTAGATKLSGIPQFSGTNSTGAGSALLASNCPAVTASAPYTWITVKTSDGSTGYMPVWK